MHLKTRTTRDWLNQLEPTGIWCSGVFDYQRLLNCDGYRVLEMDQAVQRGGEEIRTTRCPIQLDGAASFRSPCPQGGE